MLHQHGYSIVDQLALIAEDYEAYDAIWDAVFGREPADSDEGFVRRREASRASRLGGLFARMRRR